MSLYPLPIPAILDNIEELNTDVVLDQADYNFSAPVAVAPDGTGTNTTMNISAKGVSSAFAGDVTVRHIRLNLADLITLVGDTIETNGITSTMVLANQLNVIYGTRFTTDDIVDTPVALVNGAGQVLLEAKPTSHGWIGQVTFNIVPGRYDLSKVVTSTTLNGLNYPDPYENKPFGNSYSYWRDFSAQHALLDALHTGESGDLVNVKDVLVAITGDGWVTTGNSRYSLDGAEILFVGDTVDYPEMNQKYARGVVVKLGTACLGLSGRMFLQYNLPTV